MRKSGAAGERVALLLLVRCRDLGVPAFKSLTFGAKVIKACAVQAVRGQTYEGLDFRLS